MRIIAGSAKGRSLVSPRGSDTRPLTDRTREALFSALGSRLVGASVLDLYAGSGSLGLEALSRGAADVVFVERGRAALAALGENLERVGLGGRIDRGDVMAALRRLTGPFDVVFVDPPFAQPDEEVDATLEMIGGLLAVGGVAVVHRRRGARMPVATVLTNTWHRRYGDGEVWWFEREETP